MNHVQVRLWIAKKQKLLVATLSGWSTAHNSPRLFEIKAGVCRPQRLIDGNYAAYEKGSKMRLAEQPTVGVFLRLLLQDFVYDHFVRIYLLYLRSIVTSAKTFLYYRT